MNTDRNKKDGLRLTSDCALDSFSWSAAQLAREALSVQQTYLGDFAAPEDE